MTQKFKHSTGGRTCSRAVTFEITDGVVHNVAFEGGCRGTHREWQHWRKACRQKK